MSRIKRWNGSKWVDHLPRKRSGNSWVDAVVRRWTGSRWEIISEKEYTKTWKATWSSSYYGASNSQVITRKAKWGDTLSHYALWWNNSVSTIMSWNSIIKSPHYIYEGTTYIVDKKPYPKRRNTSGWMYQGRYSPSRFQSDMGRQRAMVGFNDGDIRNNLKGAKIEKVEIYLRNRHFWYANGGKAVIGYHNSSTDKPSSFSETKHGAKEQNYSKRSQGQWITMPDEFGELLRDNKAKGFTLYANTHDLKKYGYFYGVGTSNPPQIRITYKK